MTTTHEHAVTHSPQTPDRRPVLVVGATGKTGSRVADRLDALGVEVRRASRSSATPFDWTDRTTWAAALAGAGAVYLTYQPDLLVPGALGDIEEFVWLAEQAGLTRLVLLAGRGEPEAAAAGRVVLDSAIDATVLNCAWFDQNFDEGAFAPEIAAGVLTVPVGEVAEPFIDVGDIADVAVAVLLDRRPDGTNPHAGATYDLTGPRLLSFTDVVAEIGSAAGRTVAVQSVPTDAYRSALLAQGVPVEMVDLLSGLFTLFDGRNASVSGDVERLLGRPATDVAAFAAAATWR